MIRRLKKDVYKELPNKLYQVIKLPLSSFSSLVAEEIAILKKYKQQYNKVKAKYKKLQKQYQKTKTVQTKEELSRLLQQMLSIKRYAFSEISKVRHKTALAKIDHAIAHIENILENVDKLVVFAHHKDVIKALYNHFKDIAVKLTGEDKLEDREKVVKEFQNNPNIKLFIGSIQACGVGITLTASNTVLFVELDWTPANMRQAEDRVHRIGQEKKVLIQLLYLQ